jgi:ATP-dependent helicase/nuclease subunit A
MAIARPAAMNKKPKFVATPEQRKASNPAASAWVAASAGSGKTQVLVDRVIRLLLDGAEPQAMLCLTFTKAAAAEMANRLYDRLSTWIALSDQELDEELGNLGLSKSNPTLRAQARRLFARALETPGGLKIQTIHAFCERLLQLFPVESGMAPGFRVMSPQDTEQLLNEAFLASLASQDQSTQEAWSFLSDGAIANLKFLKKTAKPFLEGAAGVRQQLSEMEVIATLEATLKDTLEINDELTADQLSADLCNIDAAAYADAAAALTPLDSKYRDFYAVQHVLESLHATTPEERTSALASLALTSAGLERQVLIKPAAAKAAPATAEWLELEQTRIIELLQQLALRKTLEANLKIYRAMAGVLARLNLAKRARGMVDFDDLIARTASLLNSSEAAQWVLYKLDKGLKHILVDEAQDTSPAQWSIIQALAGEFFTKPRQAEPVPRTVFAVGDLKQSIFSFQGADVQAFSVAREGFDRALLNNGAGLEKVDLTISYRSTAEVLAVVDHVFRPGSFARTGFGARAAEERPHTAFHANRPGVFELWDMVKAEDDLEPDYWAAPVDRPPKTHPRLLLANRIAKTIASWIGKRQLLARNRAVAAGDILILTQSRKSIFSSLISALRQQGVPVTGADRLELQNSLIVHDLQAFGQVLRMPEDDHALACVLKSPLVPKPLSEKQLFELAYNRQTTSLWLRLQASARHRKTFEMLRACFDRAGQGPFVLFSYIAQRQKRAVLRRLGPEAEDAMQEFLNLALDYEQQHGTSLVGFLDWFSDTETTIKREMEANTGAVRLMTVHGSKGLEAPIVFLADAADLSNKSTNRIIKATHAGPWRSLPIYQPKTMITPDVLTRLKQLEHDGAMAERMRLLYVGMTRAADELYVCGSQSGKFVPKECWYNQVAAAFDVQHPSLQLTPVTLDDGFVVRRFGAAPQAAAPTQKDPPQVETLPAWATTALPQAAPSLLVPAKQSHGIDEAAIRRGIATHKLVEFMVDAAPDQRQYEALQLAEHLGLEPDVVHELEVMLGQPEMSVFLSPDGQSEVNIWGEVAGLGQVTGRVDRMVIQAAEIFILDYKTDRRPVQDLTSDHGYVRQLARYCAVLQLAYPRHRLKAALLWTQTGGLTWLKPELLSRALEQQMQLTA